MLALLITIKYATSLGSHFNINDDQPAYLLQLSRMLQTGSIGRDPFSLRQLLSLNGQTFLLGLVGSVSPLKYAFLLDPGICWIMIAGLTWFFVRRDLGGSIRDSCVATGLVLMSGFHFQLNLGGNLTGAVLYLTLFRIAYRGCGDEGILNGRSLLLLACTVAALCALKMTFLMYGVLFLVSWYGSRMLSSPRFTVVRELSLIGLVTLALLLPWMWQQYRSGGTPLYPFLGKGSHQSSPSLELVGDSVTNKAKFALYYAAAPAEAMPVIFGLFFLACEPWEDRCRWRIFFASLFSILIISLTLAFQLVSEAVSRYIHPVVYAGLIPLGLYGFFRRRSSNAGTGLALCLAMFVGARWENLHTSMMRLDDFRCTGPYGFLFRDEVVQRIRKAQATIPPGKRILASVEDGYLLDLARNPTWSLDLLGMASPPPGLPITTDPAAVQDFILHRTTALPAPCPSRQVLDYLGHVGIDFLLFQRGNGSTWYLRSQHERSWGMQFTFTDRVIHANAKLVHTQLLELMSKCPKLYDDGDMVVLDLRNEQ